MKSAGEFVASVVIDRLREALGSEPKPLIICGAGVSIHASGGMAPNWPGLIEAGVDRAESIDPNLHAWADWARHRLQHEGAASWIEVADELTTRLGGQHNAEFLDFIEEKVGRLELRDTQLIETLLTLGCPLATTNYDDLLSRASGLPVVNWTEAEDVARCLSGQWSGIIHLHGYWRKPETVVLGTRSYNQLVSDERSQLINQMATLTRSTIFVGCSFDGISDPNFAELDRFIGQWQAASQPRFVLVNAEGDIAPRLERRLYPVVYGSSHNELLPFLKQLAAVTTSGASAKAGIADVQTAVLNCIDKKVPKPDLFGRDASLQDVIDATTKGRSVIIAGGPGMGKTALAIATLYDQAVKELYKDYRIFVSLDEAAEPRALLSRLADELGLPAAGDEVSLLRSIEILAAAHQIIAILDNAELVFEGQRSEAERLLRLASQIDGLTIILTIRGAAPHLPSAFIIDDLAKLSPAAAEEAFLTAAGTSFANDPDLAGLVGALDGHALSIQLIAAQAAGTPRLKPLREAWNERHAAILVSGEAQETRSSSLRASLALSVESQKVKSSPLSKKLLSILAYLPGGLSEDDVPKLLGGPGQVTRVKAAEATAVLHKLRLVEHRLDARLRMLNPLREGVRLLVPIGAAEKRRLIAKFVKLARAGGRIGSDGWTGVRDLVEREKDNLDTLGLEAARSGIDDSRVQDALWNYASLARFTGAVDISSLEFAAEHAHKKRQLKCATHLLFALGNIYADRMNYEASHACFTQSDSIASAIGLNVISAQCLYGLGKICYARSDHQTAEKWFRKSLKKIASDGSLVVANILMRLGEIRLRQNRYEDALDLVEQARHLFRDDSLGMCNICSLSSELNPEEAPDLLMRAANLAERIGIPVSQAQSLLQLGAWHAGNGNYGDSIACFSQSLDLGKSTGTASVQAEALLRRGRALICIQDLSGQEEVEEGINLYLRVTPSDDRARSGWLTFRQALYSKDLAEITSLRLAAASEWAKVERNDLIKHFVNNLFPCLEPISLTHP